MGTIENSLTLKETIDEVINDLGCIVKHYPYIAFLPLSALVELFGNIISNENCLLQKKSKRYFNKALAECDTLKKYRKIAKLYKGLRCCMVHRFQSDVKLAPDSNNFKDRVIGCKDFYSDIKSAWENIKQDEKYKLALSNTHLNVQGCISGGTISNITKAE